MKKKNERKKPNFPSQYKIWSNSAKINEKIAMEEWEAANQVIIEYNQLLMEHRITTDKVNLLEEEIQHLKMQNIKNEAKTMMLLDQIVQMESEFVEAKTEKDSPLNGASEDRAKQEERINSEVVQIISLFEKEPLISGLLLQEDATNIKNMMLALISRNKVDELGKIFNGASELYNNRFERSNFFRDDAFLRLILQPIIERKLKLAFGENYDFCMRIMEIERSKHELGKVTPSDYYICNQKKTRTI